MLEPFGVVGGIIPFNWPPIHTGGKIAPALAAGNTVVLKPSEAAPLTVIRIVELCNQVLRADVLRLSTACSPAFTRGTPSVLCAWRVESTSGWSLSTTISGISALDVVDRAPVSETP